ncbi:MAG: ANTAR domain-containing protein [Oleispira sp.]|nr:ANTAR domain-containing protein [Oleispira sp.]
MIPARVMLVDNTPKQSLILEQALLDQGFVVACRLTSAQGLIKNVEVHQPDIIIMNLESPDKDTFENITVLSQYNPKPMIIFSPIDDRQTISQAIQAGANTYIVDDLNPRRLQPIIDAASAHFHEYQALKKELKQARDQLADRKIIDKAKGLLMKTKGLDEEQAYHAMRKMAMDQSKPLADIAQNILSLMSIL